MRHSRRPVRSIALTSITGCFEACGAVPASSYRWGAFSVPCTALCLAMYPAATSGVKLAQARPLSPSYEMRWSTAPGNPRFFERHSMRDLLNASRSRRASSCACLSSWWRLRVAEHLHKVIRLACDNERRTPPRSNDFARMRLAERLPHILVCYGFARLSHP